MPAGVSWPRYLRFAAVSMLTMFAGSQTVHVFYKPLEDIDTYIEQELAKYKIDKNVELPSSSKGDL